MRVKLTIANDSIKEGWEEVHTFEKAPSLRSALFHAEEMVRKFNATLRPGELPRRLISGVEFPMTLDEAKQLACDWNDLHSEASAEEESGCGGAAERLRMQAADILDTLQINGYDDPEPLLK
jgi:hypothetical protein